MTVLPRNCNAMEVVVRLIFCVAVNCQTTTLNITDIGSSIPPTFPHGSNTIAGSNSSTGEVGPVTSPSLSGNVCSIFVDRNSEDLKQAISLGYHMLVLLFSFSKASRDTPISLDTPQPLTWTHVSGNHGKGLLWLRQDFEMLSLASLSYGISKMDIHLSDRPEGCLDTKSASEIAADVQDLILNNLATDPEANVSWIGSEICNARFRVTDTGTEVFFVCCKKDEIFNITCYELERSIWMNIFLLSILILPFFALMFAPLMIPFELFRYASSDTIFQHKVCSQIRIRITKDSDNDRVGKIPLKVSKRYFNDMPRFCSTLSTLNDNITFDCTLEKIYFYVDKDNLIGKDTDPFGPFDMLYNMLARYEQRRRTFREGTSIGEFFSILLGKILNTGYLLLIIILVNIPVIAKTIYFIIQINPDWYIINTLEKLNQTTNILQYASFGIILSWRKELYLVYLVLIVLFVLAQFFKIRGTHHVDIVIEILKQCLRDSRKRRIKLAFQTIYKACHSVVTANTVLGRVLALVYFILFLPFTVFTFVFYLFPTVNLTCSVPIYFVTFVLSNKSGCISRSRSVRAIAKYISDGLGLTPIFLNQSEGGDTDDDDTDKNCTPADTFTIFILILSLPVIIFVVLDCMSFYIDIFIYVLTGLLLNASFTTTYVIVSLMLVFYIRDLFDGVTNRYIKFNNTIITEAMKKTKGDILRVSMLNENLQKNTAFQLVDEAPLGATDVQVSHNDNFKLSFDEGVLRWRTKRLIFFLDRRDTPYIPGKFFRKTSVMECLGTPGPLEENLRTVLLNILQIFLFLFIIILIALAFSEGTETPGTNQTLTVIAGGLVPWLMKTLLKAPETEGVDVENLHFREVFNSVIRKYEEVWTVADIKIGSVQVSDNQTLNDVKRNKPCASHVTSKNNTPNSTIQDISTDAMEIMPSGSKSLNESTLERETASPTLHNPQTFEDDHLVILVKKKSTRSEIV